MDRKEDEQRSYFMSATLLTLPILFLVCGVAMDVLLASSVVFSIVHWFLHPMMFILVVLYFAWTVESIIFAWREPGKPAWKIALLTIYSTVVGLICASGSFLAVGAVWTWSR